MSTLLKSPSGFDPCVTYEIRKARRAYPCDDNPASNALVIKVGDEYLVCTEFPGGESGYASAAGHPVRLRICMDDAPLWVKEQIAQPTAAGLGRG